MDVCNLTHESTIFTSNAYLIFGERTTLVDVGSDPRTLEKINLHTSKIDSIVLTHQHPDHVGSLHDIMNAFQPDLHCYADHPLQTSKLTNGQKILIGDDWYEILHTPGHSTDHLVFLNHNSIFTGDIVVYSDQAFHRGSFGRTDLPGGSREDLISSIESILSNSPQDLRNMYPGHGPMFHGDVVEVISKALARAKKREPKYKPEG